MYWEQLGWRRELGKGGAGSVGMRLTFGRAVLCLATLLVPRRRQDSSHFPGRRPKNPSTGPESSPNPEGGVAEWKTEQCIPKSRLSSCGFDWYLWAQGPPLFTCPLGGTSAASLRDSDVRAPDFAVLPPTPSSLSLIKCKLSPRNYSKHLYILFHFIFPTTYEVGTVNVPNLKMRKLRHKGGK